MQAPISRERKQSGPSGPTPTRQEAQQGQASATELAQSQFRATRQVLSEELRVIEEEARSSRLKAEEQGRTQRAEDADGNGGALAAGQEVALAAGQEVALAAGQEVALAAGQVEELKAAVERLVAQQVEVSAQNAKIIGMLEASPSSQPPSSQLPTSQQPISQPPISQQPSSQ